MRDFFQFSALKAGRRLFAAAGPAREAREWVRDEALFERWLRGQTGVPIVDAAMRQLAATGRAAHTHLTSAGDTQRTAIT